ncbi:MAG: hypothetical protein E7433_00570 [Ruminococcaceae bacterium]|nr:hypothetical protein [Oscillospiraceae bacterium]
MRVIQTYTFKMSPKMPYSDYPAIARRFLEEQNLTSHRFMYFFDELIIRSIKTAEETLASGSCAKAVKDCPALGEIRFFDGELYGGSSLLFLSNIDTDTGCTEADILPHMKKIHRRYGFCECNLYYYDIDFFGEVIPCDRDLTGAEHRAAYFKKEFNPLWNLGNQPYGSGIRLHRYSTGGNYIALSIDLMHNGVIHDATPYFKAMKAQLPHINPRIEMDIYLSNEEKQEVASWDEQIAPVIERSRNFFAEQFPTKDRQLFYLVNYTIAPKLKKLAKQYGFSYHYDGFGVYVLDKRTPRGHVLRLWVDSGPSHGDTTYHVNIQGIGFCHRLCESMQTPTNQPESDACTDKFFSIVLEFEKTILPEFDAFYSETPEWFVPSAW